MPVDAMRLWVRSPLCPPAIRPERGEFRLPAVKISWLDGTEGGQARVMVRCKRRPSRLGFASHLLATPKRSRFGFAKASRMTAPASNHAHYAHAPGPCIEALRISTIFRHAALTSLPSHRIYVNVNYIHTEGKGSLE